MVKKDKRESKATEEVQTQQEEIVTVTESAESDLREELEKLRSRFESYQDQIEVMEVRQLELSAKEKELNVREDCLDKRQAALDDKSRILTQREQDVHDNEVRARNGFVQEQEEIRKSYASRLADLAKEIALAEEATANERLRAEQEGERVRCELVRQAEVQAGVTLENAHKEADALKAVLEKQKNELEDEKKKFVAAQTAFEEQESNLRIQLVGVAESRRVQEETVEHLVESRYQDLIEQKQELENRIRFLEEENNNLRTAKQKYEKAQRNADGRMLEDIIANEDRLKSLLKDKEREIFTLRADLEDADVKLTKAQAYDALADKYNALCQENQKLETERMQVIQHKDEIKRLQYERNITRLSRDAAQAECEALNVQVTQLRQTVESMKEMAARPTEREARIKDIRNAGHIPRCNHLMQPKEEMKWLQNIYDSMCSSGIRINKRLFYAFHTALKTAEWSPITVLSGVSGTGKSLLPKLYARFGGLYFQSLAVQPDWDSSQSLFGFFNALDNRFNATTLLASMVQFQKPTEGSEDENNLSDSMMIVLLDEMNLAHVELYFSELLSKLEDRRGETKNVFVEVDLGSGLEKYKVELSRNILWVGTMNEDETTKSLSDKVIDRSNMLGFRSPERFARRTSAHLEDPANEMLPQEIWNGWIEKAVKFTDKQSEIEVYKEMTENINRFLGTVGRGLGHRVWQAMENYISNHPCCIRAYAEREEDPEGYTNAIRSAFAEAVVFKVMPKLRGIEITPETKRSCFDPIGELIQKHISDISGDYNEACREDQFVWRSANYLGDDETAS